MSALNDETIQALQQDIAVRDREILRLDLNEKYLRTALEEITEMRNDLRDRTKVELNNYKFSLDRIESKLEKLQGLQNVESV